MSCLLLRLREERVDCPGCTETASCYPHQLELLAVRLRDARGTSLLVPATAIDDALAVIDSINRECLPAHARHNPDPDRRAK